jgi:SAM-dependent methyltransferase
MQYDPREVISSYTKNAGEEDRSEKKPSLRVEIPREFIKRFLKPSDVVLDAGGGTGMNAIMMAERCQQVTLLDITTEILRLAEKNIYIAGLGEKVQLVEGDITDLSRFDDGTFSFVVCVGDSISYCLDKGGAAIRELVRVAKTGSILALGCDSKYGFLRWKLAQGDLEEARLILEHGDTRCGMGPRTHLYTVPEMSTLIEESGCEIIEVASTPSISDTIDTMDYSGGGDWEQLKQLELEICTQPELLGIRMHLLFIARKVS